MKTAAIIQARMGSTRLPGKVLAEVVGQPVLFHVVNRARRARTLDGVIVATSDSQADDVVSQFCREVGVACFRGSEADVLDRYYQAARHFDIATIVRLTADCPLLDPLVVDRVVLAFETGGCDFVSNTLERSFPDGLDTEVFSLDALERTWREAQWASEREHVTPYIEKHPELFRLGNVKDDDDFSALRWTVDEPEDLEFVRAVYGHLGSKPFGMADVVALLQTHPELSKINFGLEHCAGYQRSLREDRLVESVGSVDSVEG